SCMSRCMSRRLLSAVAVAALTVGLAACGGGDDEADEPPPQIDISTSDASDGGGDPAPSDGGGDEAGQTGQPEPTADAPDIPAPDPADYAGMDEQTPEG